MRQGVANRIILGGGNDQQGGIAFQRRSETGQKAILLPKERIQEKADATGCLFLKQPSDRAPKIFGNRRKNANAFSRKGGLSEAIVSRLCGGANPSLGACIHIPASVQSAEHGGGADSQFGGQIPQRRLFFHDEAPFGKSLFLFICTKNREMNLCNLHMFRNKIIWYN